MFYNDDCIGGEYRLEYHPVRCGCSKCFPQQEVPDMKAELFEMLQVERDAKRQEKRK